MREKLRGAALALVVSLAALRAVAGAAQGVSAGDEARPRRSEPAERGSPLYPQASETRDLVSLDGIWNFRKSPIDPDYGFRNKWYKQDLAKIFPYWQLFLPPPRPTDRFKKYQTSPGFKDKWYRRDLNKSGEVIPMPVPASYNDVTEEASLRDHVGLVWYDRRFHVPASWARDKRRVWLRFSSVHYAAQVWVNGELVGHHEIGHLPFELEVTGAVRYNGTNLLTVVVDNVLLADTVPQGAVSDVVVNKQLRLEQSYTFDFFNYAGIHRSVFLYSTPATYIQDVVVNTDIQGLTGFVVYNVTYEQAPGNDSVQCVVQLADRSGAQAAGGADCAGLLEVGNAHFWWPHLMHDQPGYLYTMKVSLVSGATGALLDTYRARVGLRTVTWSNSSLFLNERPLYLRGFGMHEDSDLRGKGWDPVLWVKNFNLLKWSGANAFRTSHYPYAEEIYQLADELGVMIIDECPAGDTDIFSDALLAKHKQSLTELIRRDKNHPSVIMWSVSNEPRSSNAFADAYFRSVVQHVKSMDVSRPVTAAIAQPYTSDKIAKHMDVISFNRYNAWYHNDGQLDTIYERVVSEARAWHAKHSKPVLMSEYGADTLAGLHLYPEYVWSEEFQVALMSEHFKAFDYLRSKGFFVGEFIWNFADFKTAQRYTRVGGNRKGVFTRARQPKAGAHHLRARYLQLAAAGGGPPAPPAPYTSDRLPTQHAEL